MSHCSLIMHSCTTDSYLILYTFHITIPQADDGLGYQVGKITPVTVFAKTIGHYNMQCSPAEYYTWILESLLILLLVPLLDQVIYPILGEFTPSMLRRIGIGFCAVILCCGFELGIEHAVVATASNGNVTSCDRDNDNLSSVFTGYYLLLIVILPVLLVTMAEICGTVSGEYLTKYIGNVSNVVFFIYTFISLSIFFPSQVCVLCMHSLPPAHEA